MLFKTDYCLIDISRNENKFQSYGNNRNIISDFDYIRINNENMSNIHFYLFAVHF